MESLQHRVHQLEQALNVCRSEATALRTSEAHYRELFVNASDAIAVFNLDGVITETNQEMTHLLGWSQAELIGQHFGQVRKRRWPLS